MKISKPISTISYNTLDFLKETLDTQVLLRNILYYEFIEHLPDTDEKKKHIHLYIVPNKALDLSKFSEYFKEPDTIFHPFINAKYYTCNNFNFERALITTRYKFLKTKKYKSLKRKPLKCIMFRKSNTYGDWYWYVLHDKDYLKAKMLERNKYYADNDIFSSDIDTHINLVQENPLINYANMSDIAIRDFIFNAVSEGVSLKDVLGSGLIPLGKTPSVIAFYNAMNSYYSPTGRAKYCDKQVLKEISDERKKEFAQQSFNNLIDFEHAVDFSEDPIFDE